MISASSGSNFISESQEILVLDGGLSNVLQKYVNFKIDDDPLWTARALADSPEAIVQAHLDYLNAGADIISTCSYQASVTGFSKYLNLSSSEGEALIKKSVDLAKQAVDDFCKSQVLPVKRRPLIGASIGPYGAHLCDRSEYTGNYMNDVSEEELSSYHLSRLRIMIDAGIDIVLIETMPSVREVHIILKTMQELTSLPTLISFSVKSGQDESSTDFTTSYGDDIKSIMDLLMKFPSIIGFGINCCSPNVVQKFLDVSTKEAATIAGFEIGKYRRIVYPNIGNWCTNHRSLDDGQGYSSLDNNIQQWISSGANIIGGCCQVGPQQINKIRKTVDNINETKK